MKRIFDSSGGVVSTIETDDLAGTTTIGQSQDVEPILEQNKKLQTLNDGYSPSRDIRRVGSIPPNVLTMWCKEDGISLLDYMRKPRAYQKWLRKKLYDPENSFFLTAPHKRAR